MPFKDEEKRKIYNHERYQRTKEQRRKISRQWYHDNKDRAKARHHKWYSENKEYISQKGKEYYQNNKEKILAYGLEWSRKNIDKRKEQYERWRDKDPIRKLKAEIRQRPKEQRKRNSRLKDKFNMTIVEWEALFNEQGNVCAICKGTDPGSKAGWNTDHCHKSGKFRFILCCHCNRGLGAFKDNPELLRRAADMLESFKAIHEILN